MMYHSPPPRRIKYPIFEEDLVVGYFDGVEQLNLCGAGMVLKLDESRVFNVWMGAGIETNTGA